MLLQGKKLVFVTNNSTKSRKGYLGKFTGLGLNVSAEEIYSSSYAAAAYLESIDFPKDKKVQISTATPEQPTQEEPFCPCCAELNGFQGAALSAQPVGVTAERAAQSPRSCAGLTACTGADKDSVFRWGHDSGARSWSAEME